MAAAPAIDQMQAGDHCFSRTKPGAGSSLDQLPAAFDPENWEIEFQRA